MRKLPACTPRTLSTSNFLNYAYQGLIIGIAALFMSACSRDDDFYYPYPTWNYYSVGGTISGLTADGLILQNLRGNDLAVAANTTSFQFTWKVSYNYDVTIKQQPSGLTCTVSNGSGWIDADVGTVHIDCSANTHTIGGTVSGLAQDGLVLQNNGGDQISIAANATNFQFATPVAHGGDYEVTVLTQPTGLECSVAAGTGSNVSHAITGIAVTCSDSTYTVGGSVSGLVGSVVLQNNGADDLTITADGAFVFPTGVANGAGYNVSVLSQPAGALCTVTNGSGTSTTAISYVQLDCVAVATFALTPSAGANGAISPSVVTSVSESGSQAFVATPNVGYGVAIWRVDGNIVQTGGYTYTLMNVTNNHTVAVEFGTAAISASTSALTLSVNDTASNAALTGTPRQIVFTNTGSVAVENLSINYPSLPSGTTSSTTCGSTLAAGGSCSVTVTPGSNATSDCDINGTVPAPDQISFSADNGISGSVDVLVLGYGCNVQGGYLWFIDDTTPATTSISGRVLDVAHRGMSLWSQTYDEIYGINEISTSSSPSPAAGQVAGQSACNGADDGICNSANIIAAYDLTSTANNLYAAGRCRSTVAGYSDWYLPAICEFDTYLGVCTAGSQTIAYSLYDYHGRQLVVGDFWTSTQNNSLPAIAAYGYSFGGGGTYSQNKGGIGTYVHCARSF